MPIPIIAEALFKGLGSIPYSYTILKIVPWIVLVYLLKLYFGGARNTSERLMHSKVVMITGGTSGIGAAIAKDLAQRGAQIILLTQHAPSDAFLAEFVEDMRTDTGSELIYAEQVDLSSLHSIRLFATKWVDNAPPRRLDMLILCAATLTPPRSTLQLTQDGVELNWGINYLANFHLLSILSPAIRAQPADRDVRVIFSTCASYIGGQLDMKQAQFKKRGFAGGPFYGSSKLALMVFAQAFQKHLDAYQRPDKQPNNARVIVVDPGSTRTPGMRRWLGFGSLWGLWLYLVMWPIWWLILKSPENGAQSYLRAAMEAELGRGAGGKLIKECREVKYSRTEIKDVEVARELWGISEKQIQALEKEGAEKRAAEKQRKEEAEKESSNSNEQVHESTRVTEVTDSTSTGVEATKASSRRTQKAA
ncbi:MAG: hypothetical protein M1827_002256 [Pycnora praestabilis]|nr:MAG: hypothetical protein M1827_002256 [Pycnora praestabilis]